MRQQDLQKLYSPHLDLQSWGQSRKGIHLRPPSTSCLRQDKNPVSLRFSHKDALSHLNLQKLPVVVATCLGGWTSSATACEPVEQHGQLETTIQTPEDQSSVQASQEVMSPRASHHRITFLLGPEHPIVSRKKRGIKCISLHRTERP